MKTNWIYVALGAVAISSVPASFGLDADVALPLGALLLGKGFGVV